jgi:hypothetical protein
MNRENAHLNHAAGIHEVRDHTEVGPALAANDELPMRVDDAHIFDALDNSERLIDTNVKVAAEESVALCGGDVDYDVGALVDEEERALHDRGANKLRVGGLKPMVERAFGSAICPLEIGDVRLEFVFWV